VIFTDTKFWLFFIVVVVGVVLNQRLLRSVRLQNLFLLCCSYYFYAQWDWRFLSLIVISTTVDFIAGGKIFDSPRRARRWLTLSIVVNLGILGFFKYFDFFITEAVAGLNALGISGSATTLNIILPVGISFYTFQTMTYALDIYRGQMKPTRDPVAFAAYVAFFPQLVAGPIERAQNLLPQFSKLWRFDEEKTVQGLRLILFGMALKVIVADHLAPYVDEIFAAPQNFDGGTLALGAIYFGFQIYADFCGYSTIAIGLAKILGFELMTNFRTPYFATSIQDFWHRWHISLSTFFRDYLYIPLGGSRTTPLKKDRNVLITFTVSGLWHGANWTFIVWGFYHGLLLIIQRRMPKLGFERVPESIAWLISAGVTFTLVTIGWVVFRAQSLGDALYYLTHMVTDFGMPASAKSAMPYVLLAVAIDFIWRADTRLETVRTSWLSQKPLIVSRWTAYTFMFWMIVVGLADRAGIEQFIYFQF
jgi:D-alanyl-lipoteichoic acid acyltransferase DltB (MBOAT superfamily)